MLGREGWKDATTVAIWAHGWGDWAKVVEARERAGDFSVIDAKCSGAL